VMMRSWVQRIISTKRNYWLRHPWRIEVRRSKVRASRKRRDQAKMDITSIASMYVSGTFTVTESRAWSFEENVPGPLDLVGDLPRIGSRGKSSIIYFLNWNQFAVGIKSVRVIRRRLDPCYPCSF
jgi:hypothetical protein